MTRENFRFEDGEIVKTGIAIDSQAQTPAGQGLGDNVLQDSGFEDAWQFRNWIPSNWNSEGTPTLYIQTKRTSDCRLGNWACELHHDALSAELSNGIDGLTSGREYTLSGYLKLKGSGDTTGAKIKLYDGTGKWFRFTGEDAGTWQTGEDEDSVKVITPNPNEITWHETPDFSEVITAPTSGYILLVIDEDGGTTTDDYILVDFIQFVDNVTGLNKIVNGDFENWDGQSIGEVNVHWAVQNLAGDYAEKFVKGTGEGNIHSGNLSMKLTPTEQENDNIICMQGLYLDTGLNYRASAWLKNETGTTDQVFFFAVNDEFNPTQYWDFTDHEWKTLTGNLAGLPETGKDYKTLTETMTLSTMADDVSIPENGRLAVGVMTVDQQNVYIDDFTLKPIIAVDFVPAKGLETTIDTDIEDLTDADTLLEVKAKTDSALKIAGGGKVSSGLPNGLDMTGMKLKLGEKNVLKTDQQESLGTNIADNPGFENWNTTYPYYTPDNWNDFGDTISVSKSLDAHTGTYAVKLEKPAEGDGGMISQVLSGLTPETDYTFYHWGKKGQAIGKAVVIFVREILGIQKFWNFTGINAGTWTEGEIQEQIENGGFETWSETDPSGWTFDGGSGDASLSKETTIVHSGSNACKIVENTGRGTLTQQNGSVSQGKTGNISFYSRGDEGGESVGLLLIAHDGENDYAYNFTGENAGTWTVLTGDPSADQVKSQELTTSYAEVTATYTGYSNNPSTIYIVIASSGLGETIYVDDVSLNVVGETMPTADQMDLKVYTDSYAQYSSTCNTDDGTGLGVLLFINADEAETGDYILVDTADFNKSGGSNELSNFDFENWTPGGDPTISLRNWSDTQIGAGTTPTITREASIKHAGNYAVKLSNPGTSHKAIGQVKDNLTEDDIYRLKFWSRYGENIGEATVFLLNDDMPQATQIYNFTTEAWETYTGNEDLDSDNTEVFSLTDTYTQYTLAKDVPVPASGKLAPYLVDSQDWGLSEGVAYFDDVTLQKVTIIPATDVTISDNANVSDYADLEATDWVYRNRTTGGTPKELDSMKATGEHVTDLDEFDYSDKPMSVGESVNDDQAITQGQVKELCVQALTPWSAELDLTDSDDEVSVITVPTGQKLYLTSIQSLVTDLEGSGMLGSPRILINGQDWSIQVSFNNSENLVTNTYNVSCPVLNAGDVVTMHSGGSTGYTSFKGKARLLGFIEKV